MTLVATKGTLSALRQAAVINTLRGCPLFGGLASADLARVAGISAVQTVDPGAYLFHEGDPANGFYVVQRGALSVHRVNAAGKEQVIHVFRPGESFAEATLGTECGYPADARALESSQVLFVRKAGFLELLRRQPELALRMLASMSLHLRTLVGQLEDLTMKDVETRLAAWLIQRCPAPQSTAPCTVELTMTKRALAAEIGTVSETLSRTLAKFRQHGLIQVTGRSIRVLSPAALAGVPQRNDGCVGAAGRHRAAPANRQKMTTR